MRRAILVLLVVFCIGGLRAGIVNAQHLPPAKLEQIERLVKAFMSAHSVPGLSIALVVDGEPLWSKGYGIADLENNVPAKASTAYRSASIGKTMTATAAMQLVERRKLDLDADVQQYCSAWPRKEQRITANAIPSFRQA